jgi:anaerobic nitric oxide reductase transcription regulator
LRWELFRVYHACVYFQLLFHLADVRLLAATNRRLSAEVEAGRFRADLYHRLNVYPLTVPPLRERTEDIPDLCHFFCQGIRRRLGVSEIRLAGGVIPMLQACAWPGNVRELENVLSRAALKAAGRPRPDGTLVVETKDFSDDLRRDATLHRSAVAEDETAFPTVGGRQPLRASVEAYQRRLIRQAVSDSGGNWSAAARRLGMHRSNLHTLARRLGVR